MPTWAIHLATAKKIAKNVNIDENLFEFGNILPDIPNGYVIKDLTHKIPHKKTHFEVNVLVLEHLEKRYNLRKFAEKYKEKFSNPLMLGYYTHLLADYYWNSKTYEERGVFDEEKNRVGLVLNDGKKILCNNEEARQIKTRDLVIFSEYAYKNHLMDKLNYTEEILEKLKDIDFIELDEREVKLSIKYVMDRYNDKVKIIPDGINKDYKLYGQKQIEESIDDCVIFILKMIKKHAEYLLNY